MEVYEAADILLKAVHDDINGRIIFSDFLAHQTLGYNSQTAVEITGIYNKALLVLIDEGLCHRGVSADTIELGQQGIDFKGNYKKFQRKKRTRNFLEKTRRILPIISFILFLIGFYITYMKKTSNARKIKAYTAQTKKDSILHNKGKK